MMPKFSPIFFIVLTLFTITKGVAAEAEHVGIVKLVAGDVVIMRNNTTIKAAINSKLMKLDVIRTGTDGKAGLIFEDDTTISLGPNSKIAIEEYMFQPSERKLSLIARIFYGTASYISGQIAKLAPNQVQMETPHATIGTRGTAFLVMVPAEK
jgi:hypothetical protein